MQSHHCFYPFQKTFPNLNKLAEPVGKSWQGHGRYGRTDVEMGKTNLTLETDIKVVYNDVAYTEEIFHLT